MPYIYFAIAFILNFVPSYLSYVENDFLFVLMNDVQLVALSMAAYTMLGPSRWRLRVVSLVISMMLVATGVHNALLYLDVLTNLQSIIYSISIIAIVTAIASVILLSRWDRLPTTTATPGSLYEVISRPQTHIQYLMFIITLGRGGSYAITDGDSFWHFTKVTDSLSCEKLQPRHLTGKKIVRIGPSTTEIISLLNTKINTKWSLLNNCLTTLGGYKYD